MILGSVIVSSRCVRGESVVRDLGYFVEKVRERLGVVPVLSNDVRVKSYLERKRYWSKCPKSLYNVSTSENFDGVFDWSGAPKDLSFV
jgi:hypothetical protein